MTSGATQGTYPIRVVFDTDQRIGRLWAFPILGWLVRMLALIPHVIALYVVGAIAAIAMLFVWIPVLLFGRFPGWGYTLIGGLCRWSLRVTAWAYMMVGPYPPFSLSSGGYPVDLEIDESGTISRLWGIPLVGLMVRMLLLIPHLVVLYVIGMVASIVALLAWIPVLFTGRYPGIGYTLVGGLLRWSMRASLWLLRVPAPYPPFRLGN